MEDKSHFKDKMLGYLVTKQIAPTDYILNGMKKEN